MSFSRLWRWWPIAFLAVVSFFIYSTNFSYGSYLLGWDVTAPELNISLQLHRILSSVWQEYRGLGTVDTFGHSTNIVHWFYIFLLSRILPQWLVRYTFIILAHFVGGLGMYILLKNYVLPKVFPQATALKTPALLGGLLYMLNLATIQMFFLAFEVFVIHFALLPWAIWSLVTYLEEGSPKKLLRLLIVSVLGLSQAYVPTVFVTYMLTMAIILLISLLQFKKTAFLRFLLAVLVFFCVNASWGFPYVYATLTQAGEIATARMNVYSTAGIFYRNFAWADFTSIIKFGGLHLGFYDWYNDSNNFQRIMREWYSYYGTASYSIVAEIFSFLGWVGLIILLIKSTRSKHHFSSLFALFTIGVFSLFMLGTNIPGISFISQFLRDTIPLFFQIFRFTFTKFSLLYATAISIGFGISVTALWLALEQRHLPKRVLHSILFFVFINAFVVISFPVWQGQFFYNQMLVKIPRGYHEMVAYLNENYPQGRVFGFPVHSFWGWTTNTNTWGYRGSGIIWQSIQQPIFDRAFDWNKENETAFNQLNRALYTLDKTTFLKLFEKYHTNLILYDTTVFHPGNYPTALFKEETKRFFHELPELSLEKSTDVYELYTINNQGRDLSLFSPSQLTKISPNYQVAYTTKDQAYLDVGDYYQTGEPNIEYPFSYLNSEKIDHSFLEKNATTLELTLSNPSNKTITIPSFIDNTSALPIAFFLEKKSADVFELSWEIQLPTIKGQTLNIEPTIATSSTQIKATDDVLYVAANNEVFFVPTTKISAKTKIGTTALKETKLAVNVYTGTPSEVIEPINALLSHCKTHDRTTFDISNNTDCQFSQTVSPIKSGALAAFIVDYTSTHSTRPYICVTSSLNSECLSDPHYNAITTSNQWETYVSYAQISKIDQLLFDIREERTRNKETGEIKSSVSKPQLQIFPLVASNTIDLSPVLTQYKQSFQATDNELSFSIPLGTDNAFVISHNEKDIPYGNCSFGTVGSTEKTTSEEGTTFTATNQGRFCETILYTALKTDLEYLYQAKGKSLSGSRLQASLINPLTRRADLEIFFPENDFSVAYPIYPSQNTYYSDSKSFLFNLVAESYGPEKNQTFLSDASFITLPLSWFTKIKLQPQENPLVSADTSINNSQKIGTFYYSALVSVKSPRGFLVLPQRFDQGWLAYEYTENNPFNGKVLEHFMYNGWGNVWQTTTGEHQVILIFWPQLLSYFGYGLLIVITIILLFKSRQPKLNS